MDEIKFTMETVTKKREKVPRTKGSKYDVVVDQFMSGGHELVEITSFDIKASYFVTQLNKRIDLRNLPLVASCVGDCVYLEKAKPVE